MVNINKYDTNDTRMRFTTKSWAAFRVKSFKAAVIRRKWLGGGGCGGGGGGGRGGGRRLEVTDGRATSQKINKSGLKV